MSHPILTWPEPDFEVGCLFVSEPGQPELTDEERVRIFVDNAGRCLAHVLGRCASHAPLGLDAKGRPICSAKGDLR